MQATGIGTRILHLCKNDATERPPLPPFADGTQVTEIHSFDEALTALSQGLFDFVLSGKDDFVSLERVSLHHRASLILETIGHGVCIVEPDGRVAWSNGKMQSYPDDLTRQICEACSRSLSHPQDVERLKQPDALARRLSLTAGSDQYFEVTVTPVIDESGRISQMAAVAWDVTHARRLQKKIDAIDRAGRELMRIDAGQTAGMNVEERIALLEQKMLRYMHDLLHFDDFAVLLVDKKTNKLDFVLQHGMTPKSKGYDIYVSPENNGISGYVAYTGRSYICHDTSKDPRYLQGLEQARSSLTVPLRLHDKVIGVLNIESDRPAAFNEDDRQSAEILAGYVAIALNILDLLVMERYESTGRLADDVIGEITGPLNDIITDARTLMDEYIGNDEMRRRLNTICDNVTEIKRIVRDVATPKGGLLGRLGQNAARDPVLDGKRVLVADDEETIRETIAEILRKKGCAVDTAADGREAVERLKAAPYDILLADIRMPHKNGYEVFAAARDIRATICVMLMTGFGYDPNHSIVRSRQEGLNAVLFKPFKVEQLITELHAALSKKPG